MNYTDKTVKSVYDELERDKSATVQRAEDCAKLTIPSIFPTDEINDDVSLDDVSQSLGARAVLNLASKFMQTLLPSTQPFFKLMPSKDLEEQILSGDIPELLDNLNEGLVKLETGIQHEMERQSIRSPIHEAIKLNIVTGNALLWKDGNSLSVFSLRSYVVKRDASGNLLDVVVREKVSPTTLPEDIPVQDDKAEYVYVYTRLVLDSDGKYQMYQEIEDKVISGSEKTYNKDDVLPFIVLRWTALPNSNYGRGLVEHYLGDLRNYEAINMVITDIASVMSRVVFMVNPNSQFGTDVDDLNATITGDYVSGHADDITVPQTNKQLDLRVLLDYMQILETRLSQAFLLFTSRDAERVTAEEIRIVSQQLEETLGGVYSLLADDMQKPLLAMYMEDLNIELDEQIDAVVTSGLDALGRGTDANRLFAFIEGLSAIPEGWAEVKQDTLVSRLAYSTGVDVDNLLKTPEDKQAEAKAMQDQQTEGQFATSLAQAGGQAVAQAGGDALALQT
jgi:hypothetical protein